MGLKQGFSKLPLFAKLAVFFMAVVAAQFVLLFYLWTSHGAGFAQMFGLVLTPLFLLGDFALFLFLNLICVLRGLATRAWGSVLLSGLILGAAVAGFNQARRLMTTQFQVLTQTQPPAMAPAADAKTPAGFLMPPPGWPSASYSLSTSDYSDHGYSMIFHKQDGATVVTLREDDNDILNRCAQPFEFHYGDVLERKTFSVKDAGEGVVFTVKANQPQYEAVLKDGARCLSLSITNVEKKEFTAQNIIEDLQAFPRSP